MSVEAEIYKLIQQHGRITVAQLMHYASVAHRSSYYRKQSLLGEEGDFLTSPEVSQLFGEMIGIWCIQRWYELGSPKKCTLIELGPGRGLLMRDLLRVARLVPEFYNSIKVQLIDINPQFIQRQKSSLHEFNLDIKWLPEVSNLNQEVSIIIANEFFDSLPIRQYKKLDNSWHEIVLIIDSISGKLAFNTVSTLREQQVKLSSYTTAPEGGIIEESSQSQEIIAAVAHHLRKYGGAALIIDYGYDIPNRTEEQYNGTLQALKAHRYHPLLEEIGEADLSAHVDFNALKQAACTQGVRVEPITLQEEFLISHGILLRARHLCRNLTPADRYIINRQVSRLIDPKQMGELFKVLSFHG